jgi:hypothetical protein
MLTMELETNKKKFPSPTCTLQQQPLQINGVAILIVMLASLNYNKFLYY